MSDEPQFEEITDYPSEEDYQFEEINPEFFSGDEHVLPNEFDEEVEEDELTKEFVNKLIDKHCVQ